MRLLALYLLVAAGTAFAQEAEENASKITTPAQSEETTAEVAEMGGDRVDPRELLEQVMIARLSKELALDDEQTVLLVRRFMEHREYLRTMRQQRYDLLRDLKQAVRGTQDEDEVAQKLDALIEHDETEAQSRKQLFESATEGLTSWQRARLYVFMTEFESDMRRMVQRARERSREHGGRDGKEGYRRAPERDEKRKDEKPEEASEQAQP